ncbi:MAG: DUF6562 domain-containing protein [Bacteroidales bacterium]|nr:DUF6562 domain-containing protein [Bacteroidales bacterium]
MKKFFRYAAAIMILVAAFACQRENIPATSQDEVEVTFAINTESAIATKAAPAGTGIGYADTYEKELLFYVYKDGVLLDQLQPEIEDFQGADDLDAKVSVRLVKGQDYEFVFWAQAEGKSHYTLTAQYPPYVTVNYDALAANDESRDAFYAVAKLHIEADMGIEKITLTRPFAQINVGTTQDDIDAAKAAGVVIDNTSVTLSNVATKLDLFSGAASEGKEFTFKAAALPQQKLNVYNKADYPTAHEYSYLSMNYILVADAVTGEKDQLDAYKITFLQGTREINTISIPNVPVRRNWRTNIIGENILTDYASFEITIDPDFYGEYDYSYPDGGVVELPYDQNQPVDNNLYLKPNENWKEAGARFAIYFWDTNVAPKWENMTDSDGDGIYEIDKSRLGDCTNIIFCRMNPDNSNNDWNTKWNQTSDLKVPTDGTNLYTVKEGTWDNGAGTWSTK